ncbi:pentatricopeptide repeat-containing protein At3g21470 [Apium graveolens]|uniref:pentatricopeptide repeat-containing protein At3g21470 n=1 Tax=Apium graveolens TaxID=4045 RepID=UPI003D7BDD53
MSNNRKPTCLSSENSKLHHASSNWSSTIKNFIAQGAPKQALKFYANVRNNHSVIIGVIPLLLKACTSLSMLYYGRVIHSESIKSGALFDVMVGTSLINMYGKCECILDARMVFDNMSDRNVVSWNAMIGGYMKNGDAESASRLFEEMPARTEVSWIEMVEGYARNGDMVGARELFDRVPLGVKNVVIWTVMVDGYASNGDMDAAREVFEAMPCRNFFVWSSMICGYLKKGDVLEAEIIFSWIPVRNLVHWNSLISGYAQNGCCRKALDAFMKMRVDGFEPDEVTLVSILSVCGQLGLLDKGKEVHELIRCQGIKHNQFIMNGLVDMYAKCGDITSARLLFEGMVQRNDACWNSMISGLAIHGQCKEAIEFFGRMEKSGEKPNSISFLSVLSACAHGGYVEEGLDFFSKLKIYDIAANIKHYGCLIDLLGRAGKLKEAYDLIKEMPVRPNDTVWGALLGACRIHSDMEMADRILEEVRSSDSDVCSSDDSHYVLLSNIYAASERWENAERMRIVISSEGILKTPGSSSIILEHP